MLETSGFNYGYFLDKGASFWSRTLLTWDTTAPLIVLFATILRAMSLLIDCFFNVIKLPSAVRFVAVQWRACLEGLFRRKRSTTISTRKHLPCSFLGTFSTKHKLKFLPKRFWLLFCCMSTFSVNIFLVFFFWGGEGRWSLIKVFNIYESRLYKIGLRVRHLA